MLDAIHRAGPDERVMLFGVRIVDSEGVAMRERSFRHERYLPAEGSASTPAAQLLLRAAARDCRAPLRLRTHRPVRHECG